MRPCLITDAEREISRANRERETGLDQSVDAPGVLTMQSPPNTLSKGPVSALPPSRRAVRPAFKQDAIKAWRSALSGESLARVGVAWKDSRHRGARSGADE